MTAGPLDDIRTLMQGLPGPDEQARAEAAALIAAPGALGRLEEIALWLAAWSGKARPQVRRPILALYAGAPGPGRLDAAEAARTRLEAVASGAAAASRMAQSLGAGLEAFDLAVDRPIGDIETVPALGERECAATMAFGMEVLAKQPDLLLLGDISPDEGRSALAVGCALLDGDLGDWGGADLGKAVARARREEPRDGLDILRQLGGREVAAAAGAILAARLQRTPVVLDGAGPLAAALALRSVDPHAVDHCLVAQAVGPRGVARMADALGARPLIDLGFASSEGTAAVAALSMVKLASTVLEAGG